MWWRIWGPIWALGDLWWFLGPLEPRKDPISYSRCPMNDYFIFGTLNHVCTNEKFDSMYGWYGSNAQNMWKIANFGWFWPRASPFDLLSRFVRDFDIRQMSTYDFSDSSHHSASNDMRQAHDLMYGLRDRVPNSYLTTSPPMRGYITNFAPDLRCLPSLNSTHGVHTKHFKWNLALRMKCIRDL